MHNARLPFDDDGESQASRIDARDREGRARAVDPRFNVALEASAGTGKTRVLVDRYINLLRAGVDPSNILAMTFTRKAAAEMRERILTTMRRAAEIGELTPTRWRELRDRTTDITISTIDAFCLSLLREFPLEADLDPGFSMADDTEVPRLIDESLDRALRICRQVAREDEHVALVFAQLGDRRARTGLASLLTHRIVAAEVLSTFATSGPRELTVSGAARAGARALTDVFASMPGGLEMFIRSGPPAPAFALLARQLRQLERAVGGGVEHDALEAAAVQACFARAREHFLTQDGHPRSRLLYPKTAFASPSHWQRHRDLVVNHAAMVVDAFTRYRRDLNVLVSRGVWRMFAIAQDEYARMREAHVVLDFPDVLLRTLTLLRQMEEFAQSRYRLESRYHHVLVDEFQDTSRAQWQLVSLLVQAWGEGSGLSDIGPLRPTVFIVGDRKQSIYGFRDADVSLLPMAAHSIERLRRDGDVRRSISRSFRSVPSLLRFVNDLCHDIDKQPSRADAFHYDEQDRFPVDSVENDPRHALGIVVGDTPEECAERTADEIVRLIQSAATIRDRDSGVARAVRAGDIAILFRNRDSHRDFEQALERRRIASYVYKGLGFFDSDEIKDVMALLWYLAEPLSDLRAAAWMRSRFVGLSDVGLRRLAPDLAAALLGDTPLPGAAALDADDAAAFAEARSGSARWRGLVDRLPPAELLDLVLRESAYTLEMRGARFDQARENVKKIRALVRRTQNRGYATLGRLVAHLDRLAIGDEANAVIDALDAVNLMTVHASKGLEFPVVFVVNLARGTGNRRDPIRVVGGVHSGEAQVSVGDFESEADETAAAKDREETKRLLYVALTRARDRLYLGTVLKDGRIQPGRGSLAEVLPAPFLEVFSSVSDERAEWRSGSGSMHVFTRCTTQIEGWMASSTNVRARASEQPRVHEPDDFAAIVTDTIARTTVVGLTARGTTPSRVPAVGARSDRIIGTLAHRLVQRVGFTPSVAAEVLRITAHGLLRAGEQDLLTEAEATIDDVVRAYQALAHRADVQRLYGSGRALHEVPFTMQVDDKIVRGTIDCLVRASDGRVIVLEFKTGRPRAEHQEQAAFYAQAAKRVFPEALVESQLVYAE